MISVPARLRSRVPFGFFLIFYLFFSISTFRDYGATWDEKDAYQGGAELFQFLVHGVKPGYWDPEHGYPYTCLLRCLTSTSNFEVFHLLNLLFGTILFWAVFEVLLAETKKPWWSLAGPVFLFLCPAYLGSIPANPKDVPFAVFYFLSLAALYLFGEKLPEFKARWAVLGVLFAFAISSRIVGFTLFPILLFYDLFLFGGRDKGKKRKPKEVKTWLWKKSKDWVGTLVTSQILCMALWPYLGQNYFRNLANVFWLSAHFPPKFTFLFMGGFSDSLTYPWYYLPVMFGISTPLFILAFAAGSLDLLNGPGTKKTVVLMGSALLLNFALYFLIHPAIYDGLRHYLFLFPILSTLAAISFVEFFEGKAWPAWKKPVGVLTLVLMGLTGDHMVRLHPYEYVYYNELVGGFPGAYGKYETDYWAASMKEAVRWLETHELTDPGKTYGIYLEGHPPQALNYFNANMREVPSALEADYAIVMTRAGIHPGPGDEGKIIHRVEREGTPLSFILKLK